MSHHLDTVTARTDGRLNLTDLYVFPAPTGASTVFVLDACPDAGRSSPLTLHPDARYDIHIAPAGAYRSGTPVPAPTSLTLRVLPGRPGAERQPVTVLAVPGGPEHRSRPAGPGRVLASGSSGDVLSLDGGGRGWIGPAEDPFAADATRYFAVLGAVHEGREPDLSAPGRPGNFVEGRNVVSIVLEVPDGQLPAPEIVVWATVTVTGGGEEKQVSRWGLPNVNAHVARGDEELDEINAGHPATDAAVWQERAAARIADAVTAARTSADPQRHGRWLAERLFPQVLPYTVGTPARFGLFGINGRALHDDAIDVALSLYLDTPVDDGVRPRRARAEFPYLEPPKTTDLPPLVG